MFPFMFDWTWILLLPAIGLALWAQAKVRGTYNKYSQVFSRGRMTGAQVARRILDANGLIDIRVEAVEGTLSDHYHPKEKVVRLSKPIYGSNSLAALAVAAHETGHAMQDKMGYAPMAIRARLVPVAGFGSTLAFPLFFIGLFIPSIGWLMDVAIIFFAGAVLFHLVTLPVEFDASRRAVAILSSGGYLAPDELPQAKKVLNAAAWTYVAAATVALIHLVRLLVLRQSRD
ncbi:zinc metallopeptidase [bacterium]|nr:zinc metallopeptidase [bacterium]MBU1984895.1 zinc metallopeptidase [bacterium]